MTREPRRWDRWRLQRSRGPWSFTIDLSNVNRPSVHLDYSGDGEIFIWVDWSNGNSDPVWSICRTMPEPAWLRRFNDWRWDRARRQREARGEYRSE